MPLEDWEDCPPFLGSKAHNLTEGRNQTYLSSSESTPQRLRAFQRANWADKSEDFLKLRIIKDPALVISAWAFMKSKKEKIPAKRTWIVRRKDENSCTHSVYLQDWIGKKMV